VNVSVALVVQHALHMRHIFMCPSAVCIICPHYHINGMIFWGGWGDIIEYKTCYFDFLSNFETFFILRRIESDMIEKVCCCLCKVPVVIVIF